MKTPSILRLVPFLVLLGVLLFSANCFYSCTKLPELHKRDTSQVNTTPPITDSTTIKDSTTTKDSTVNTDSTHKPPITDTTHKPSTDTTHKPPVTDTTHKPSTDTTIKKPTTDTTTKKPTTDTTHKPSTDTTHKPPVDTTHTKPVDTTHTTPPPPPPPPTVTLTHPDHIIFVWLENKGYPQIIGSSNAPFINSLVKKGTLFTNTYAITHPSYPNYIAFFSGGTQGVKNDDCIDGTPFSVDNLYTALKAVGKSFAWYSEGLPDVGSGTCKSGNYVEKHNPVTVFSNVNASANKPFSAFPTDYSKLENVVCISPNLQNDMHDGSISQGDTWLKNKLSGLADWCLAHNSILVIYWDEDNRSSDNRIPVVAVGQHVKTGFKLNTRYEHYNWTKTLCAMFNASASWSKNISGKDVITGCWK